MKKLLLCTALSASLVTPAFAADYNSRIRALEKRIQELETKSDKSATKSDIASAIERRLSGNNDFNPAISLILDGKYHKFSEDTNEIAGFAIGEEGERASEGMSIDESELNFSANIDDKFYGSLTTAIVREDGEDKIELEEAYIQTLNNFHGFSLKAGRFFASIGYLNEHHAHTDNFANRPLPYRIFLNKAYNDDGLELSYLFPTPFYMEAGYGMFRGDDFPGGNASGEGANGTTGYLRIGGDLGSKTAWRLGASALSTKTGSSGRSSNETTVTYLGKTDFLIADLKLAYAPTGNRKNQEIILQGEYFDRSEKGDYTVSSNTAFIDDDSKGYYGELIYKFHPNYRIGYRYSGLEAAETPSALSGTTLDSAGHDPYTNSVMLDWSNSEYSRIRVQYNQDNTTTEEDNQLILQYSMSIGAHPAHKF